MDIELIKNNTTDTITFHPGVLAGTMDVDINFVVEGLSSYDSIKRNLTNITPIAIEGIENYTIVSINFIEERFLKDGSTEKEHVFERLDVVNGKVNRVVQWVRPAE